jgi:ABC-type uncharacterized transport system YnjBCD permease subunit
MGRNGCIIFSSSLVFVLPEMVLVLGSSLRCCSLQSRKLTPGGHPEAEEFFNVELRQYDHSLLYRTTIISMATGMFSSLSRQLPIRRDHHIIRLYSYRDYDVQYVVAVMLACVPAVV